MSLSMFVAELLPQLSKVRMRDDLLAAKERITVEVIPLLNSCVECFAKRDFKSPFVQHFEKELKNELHTRIKGNSIITINDIMAEVLKNCEMLDRLINKSEERFTKEAISILNVNIIQAIEGIDFIAKYTLRYLNLALTAEINVLENRSEFQGLQPAMVKWTIDNQTAYIKILAILSIKEADLSRKLSNMPDIVVSPDSANTIETTNDEKDYDPAQLGFIPVVLNPVYRLGMWIAEIQAARLSSIKAERDTVALRVVRLEQLLTDKNDPKIQREIDVYQNRLEKLEYNIKQKEEQYLDDAS